VASFYLLQYIGSTSGCGYDFPNVMLQNEEGPTVNIEEAEKDEFDKAQDISDQCNRELLVSLLRSSSKTVELYGFGLMVMKLRNHHKVSKTSF
jgi:hypothetical protein